MNDDEPSDTVHEAFTGQLFGDTPLGRPILGTVDSINAITREQIAEHYRARYTPDQPGGGRGWQPRARAGRRRGAGGVPAGARPGGGPGAAPARRGPGRAASPPGPACGSCRAASSRRTWSSAARGCRRTDDRRFALGVLNAALGGGMSSRLFQEVREKRGLAYSVYSFTLAARRHRDLGHLRGLPAGQGRRGAVHLPGRDRQGVSGGLTDAELDRGKGQLRGSIVLGLEDPSSRMSRLGKSELVYPRLEPVEEILASIEAVTQDDVRGVAAEILAQPKVLAVVGPFDDATLRRVARPTLTSSAYALTGAERNDQGRGAGRQGAHGRRGVPGRGRRAGPGAGRRRWTTGDPREPWPAATWWSTSPTPAWSWTTCAGASSHGLDTRRRHLRVRRARLAQVRDWLAAAPGARVADRAELLGRRGADDALRRAGGALLRVRRDHRAAPRGQGGRAVRDSDADRRR